MGGHRRLASEFTIRDLNDPKVEHLHGNSSRKPDLTYNNDLDLIAAAVRASKRAEQEIRTVVMPLGGVQGATAFRIFPQAVDVLVITNTQFTHLKKGLDGRVGNMMADRSDENFGTIQYYWEHVLNFAKTNVIQDVPGEGPRAWDSYRDLRLIHAMEANLGRLLDAIPGFRLIKVDVYHRKEFQHIPYSGTGNHWSVHAVIHFDTGDDTIVRRLTHIDAYVPTKHLNLENTWYLKNLQERGFDAVYVAATMGLMDIKSGDLAALSKDLISGLKKSGGILLESRDNGSWAISGDGSLGAQHESSPFSARVGYDKMVRIHRFDPH